MPRRIAPLVERTTLVALLPLVAGSVNVVGAIELGQFTSHMSGAASRVGEQLAGSDPGLLQEPLTMLGAFGLGAFLAALIADGGLHVGRYRHAVALAIEALALSTFGWMDLDPARRAAFGTLELTCLLCFAMGLQNALVTRMSGAVIRTTHVTGLVTDISIEAMRLGRTALHELRRGALPFAALRADPEGPKLRLHLTIFLSFVSGAALGAEAHSRVGTSWIAAPVALLLAVALLDALVGLPSSRLVETSDPRGAQPR